MNGKCEHCKEPLNNRVVVMGDGAIFCYTCGRLRADQRCRRLEIFALTCEELERRKR